MIKAFLGFFIYYALFLLAVISPDFPDPTTVFLALFGGLGAVAMGGDFIYGWSLDELG